MSIEQLDFETFKIIHYNLRNGVLDAILPWMRNKLTWIPLYVFFAYYLYQKFNKRMILICMGLVFTIAFSDLVCAQFMKAIFQRMRPCQLYIAEEWFQDFNLCSSTFSFPSCHASNHMAFSAFIWNFFRRKHKYIFISWVLLIGWSQVYIGVHYPLDILGGAILGLIIGSLSFKLYNFLLVRMNIKQV